MEPFTTDRRLAATPATLARVLARGPPADTLARTLIRAPAGAALLNEYSSRKIYKYEGELLRFIVLWSFGTFIMITPVGLGVRWVGWEFPLNWLKDPLRLPFCIFFHSKQD